MNHLMNPVNEFLKFLALVLMAATLDRKGSLIIFNVKELVNSSDTLSPNGLFPDPGLATGSGLY